MRYGEGRGRRLPHFLILRCPVLGVQIVPYAMLDLFLSFQGTLTIELLAIVQSCVVILSVL